jgi:hypothetical protein
MVAAPGQKISGEARPRAPSAPRKCRRSSMPTRRRFSPSRSRSAARWDEPLAAVKAKNTQKFFDISGRLDPEREGRHQQFPVSGRRRPALAARTDSAAFTNVISPRDNVVRVVSRPCTIRPSAGTAGTPCINSWRSPCPGCGVVTHPFEVPFAHPPQVVERSRIASVSHQRAKLEAS